MNKELMILSGLVNLKKYRQKVLPHLKSEYFELDSTRLFYEIVKDYEAKYNDAPGSSAFEIELENKDKITEEQFVAVKSLAETAYSEKVSEELTKASIDWMVDTTEKYCLDRSVYNAVLESVEIISGNRKNKNKDQIPSMLQDSLNVCFDPSIGHDYIRDWEDRFELYHEKTARIPFPLTMLNKTTGGGLSKKALAVPIAPTGLGKTTLLSDFSGYWLTQGHNVLYVTLEEAYDKIAKRIDASRFDVSMDDLSKYPKDVFSSKIDKIKKSKTLGRLIIKEYPTGTLSAANLVALLDDLKTKEDFVPDIVCIDYLGLVKPVRGTGNDNTYTSIKYVAEEVRSVAMSRDLLIFAPHQTNRSGQNSSDYDLTEIADSAGISMTADWIIGLMSTDELEKLGHITFKQLKNRFGDKNKPRSFVVGIDRSKMKLFDVDVNVPSNAVSTQTVNTAASGNKVSDLSSKTKSFKFD